MSRWSRVGLLALAACATCAACATSPELAGATPSRPTAPATNSTPAAPAAAGRTLSAAPAQPPSWAGSNHGTAESTGGTGGTDLATALTAPEVGRPPAFIPQTIVLPSGRSAPVVPAQVRPDGSLAVPDDPAQVGWWSGGSRAGDPFGSVVLAGHIDSRAYGIGVLAELARARAGQRIQLAAGGSVRTFRIVELREVPKGLLAADTAPFDQAVRERLVLITCGGRFDPVTHRYDDNLVVVGQPEVTQ